MKTGKHDAQSMDEMISSMEEAKEHGLHIGRGQSIYKAQSGEYQEEKLKTLITANIQQVAEFATKERVSLSNLDEIKARSIIYLRACEETGTFPSSLGLARSLGYTARGLKEWQYKHPDDETSIWLEMFGETCADILSQSALKNNANSIVTIFLNKSLYGFRETSELVVTPNRISDSESNYSVDEIRERYLMDTAQHAAGPVLAETDTQEGV